MNKAKVKAEKAVTKCKRKGRKAKSKAAVKTMSVAFMVAAIAGCQLTPSRSQTLTLRDCTINIYGGGALSNELASVEIGTQAMAIETGGNETNSPTATTDISPDIDTTVGGAGCGALESAASAVNGLKNACSGNACGL